MNLKIVIADDHPLILRGLSDFISSKGYHIIGKATDGKSAYNLIVKAKPEIAILDISMPILTGLDVAELCKNNSLPTKIILITVDKEEHLFDKAQEFGVFGYILKEFAIEELEQCIESVKKGKPYFLEEMNTYLNSKSEHKLLNSVITKTTKTEFKILVLIANQNSSQEIAKKLNSSVRTIEKHRSNIVKKLNLEQYPNVLTNWVMKHQEALLNTKF